MSMTINISRRKLVGNSVAAAALGTVAGSPAAFAQDDRPTVTVGSKDFTESIIVSEIVAQLLEGNGFDVERQLNLGGTLVAHEAMVAGDIDTYVEYTGTGLIAVLGQELPERDDIGGQGDASATPESGSLADTVYDIVAEAYPEEFNVEWLEPWGFNNTYALAMRRSHAEELGVISISDLKDHAGDLTLGSTQETLAREDGVPGLISTYDLDFDDTVALDPGLMYDAAGSEDLDVITAFATDPRIASNDLVLLEDDLGFFPPYHAAPVVRQDLLEQAPDVRDILNSVAGTLDDTRMTELNLQADVEGKEITDVARDFLTEEGLLDA